MSISANPPRRAWTDLSQAEKLAWYRLHDRQAYDAFWAALTPEEIHWLQWDWSFWGRPNQFAPPGDWAIWIIRAGRGFGKTRTSMQWLHARMLEEQRWGCIIGATTEEVEKYDLFGFGGLLDPRGKNIRPEERPIYEPSKRRLTWPNGSYGNVYSANSPEEVRGFSGDTAVLGEFAKYPPKKQKVLWDNLRFGMREVSHDKPRIVIATTPRPTTQLQIIEKLRNVVITTGSSYENRANLDQSYYDETIAPYEGTAFGRQEIWGEYIDPEEAGIVKRSWLKLWPAGKPLPVFETVIISLDTAYTESTTADFTACGVWGVFRLGERTYGRFGEELKRPLAVMLLDAWQEKLGMPDLIERVKVTMRARWGATDPLPLLKPLIGPPILSGAGGRRSDVLLIEDKGSGISLIQMLAMEQIYAQPYNPGRASKVARLHIVSPEIKNGILWIPESPKRPGQFMSWAEPVVAQLCTFAGEGSIEHDDHVDQATQALRYVRDNLLVADRAPPPADPDEGRDREPEDDTPRLNPYAA